MIPCSFSCSPTYPTQCPRLLIHPHLHLHPDHLHLHLDHLHLHHHPGHPHLHEQPGQAGAHRPYYSVTNMETCDHHPLFAPIVRWSLPMHYSFLLNSSSLRSDVDQYRNFALLYFLSLYFILLLSLLLFQYQICNWSIQNFALHNRDSSLKLFLVLVFFNINTYWYFLFKWCPEKKMTDIVWWQLLWEKYHLWEATSVLDEVYLCADLAFVPKCHRGCHRPYLS